jgi:type I restriction enzyme, R subunit
VGPDDPDPRGGLLHQGRVIVRGKTVKRGEAKKADYILYYKPNIPRRHRGQGQQPLRRRRHAAGARIRRDSRRALRLQLQRRRLPGTRPHGATGRVTREIPSTSSPPRRTLGALLQGQGLHRRAGVVATQDYYDDGSGKTPRYYQLIAINRTVEAIARGENRILLVMATGTGKTYTAFQIIWRLWKSGAKKRILFLVDRNILADQTKTNDFKPFGRR